VSQPPSNRHGPTWSDVNRGILAEVAEHGEFLPGTVAERQACKGLVKQGKLEPNGVLGYRLAKVTNEPG
jgi:hypothetical protein